MPVHIRSNRSGATERGARPRREERARGAPLAWTPRTTTIVDVFEERVAQGADRPALRESVGGSWRVITWAEYGRAVREAAAGLVRLGIGHGERVGILAGNQPRWHMADLATLASGAVSVPAYPSSASSQVAHVLGHSGARACFVGDQEQLAKLLLAHRRLPALERIVLLGPPQRGLDDDLLLTFDDLCALGRDLLAAHPGAVAERTAQLGPESLATIVYTSGTTGRPKGALITHGNIATAVDSILAAVPVGPDDRFCSFLPLSHIAERIVSHAGQIFSGGETWFARGLATLPDDLRACRPTVFFAVPRVWEKFRGAVESELRSAPRPVGALARRYVDLGLRRADPAPPGGPLRWRDELLRLALDRTVGARIRAGMGLDRGRVFVSSAAPVDPGLLRWFHAIGVPVAEAYGQTEDCGPTTLNRPGRIRIGTVGEPLPGVDVRIAADDEVLVRGGNVCRGYHDDRGATAALIEDGWLHSGDLGRFDPDGYLRIIGRKKDLIVTSSGKNVAPQDMETELGSDPLISQAVVLGDGRPYLVALLALDVEEVIARTGDRGGHADIEMLATHPLVRQGVAEAVERLNAGRSPVEQVKAWRVLPRELTVVGGELTPTLKVRRAVVAERFRYLVDELYQPAASSP